jgi:hypothetical protein
MLPLAKGKVITADWQVVYFHMKGNGLRNLYGFFCSHGKNRLPCKKSEKTIRIE